MCIRDRFSVAKAFGVTADEIQALLDYGCSEEEIEEMLYDPTPVSYTHLGQIHW